MNKTIAFKMESGCQRMARDTKGLMKLVALALAIFLWFYVGIEQNPIIERQYNIPVTMENVPAGLEATPAQKHVNILVRDRQDRMSGLQAGNFTASIDMSDGSLGQSTYPVDVRSTSGVMRHIRVIPKEMTVTLVQASGISVPIEYKIRNDAPEGVQVGQIELSTDLVLVSGPEDVLSEIGHAGVELDLSRVRETTVVSEKVRLYDNAGEALPLEGLTLNPDEILLTIPVNSQLVEKTVPVQAMTVGQPAEGSYLMRAIPDPLEVVLVGEADVLQNISTVETVPVDISGSDRDRQESARLNLPDKVSVRGLAQVDVHLQFSTDSNQALREVEIPVTIQGQGAGEVRFSGDGQVKISYSADISPEEVARLLSASIDVSGLSPGTYQLSVAIHSESQDPLEIERITPTVLSVVVE